MAGIGRPDTVRHKAQSEKRRGNVQEDIPGITPGWSAFRSRPLGRSGRVPRGTRHNLCGNVVQGQAVWSGIVAAWLRQGMSPDLVRALYGDSESGAERYAAQLYERMSRSC